jgi:NADPH-dependent 2,4-dienoyl-CoA reductase/sulfur reductase-like enzyme/nitrite reductase/ring-hydroxylating ferredoxin subunit
MAERRAEGGPDLTAGVPASAVVEGSTFAGTVGSDSVVLVRTGGRLFAVGANCTHYRGPLAEGIVVGTTIRCPLHHAAFNLETGEAVRAPALDPIRCWKVEQRGNTIFVRERTEPSASVSHDTSRDPSSVVIIGGGAAGHAAADMLRREGYPGPVTIVSADRDAPADRPNLSKDYLAGEAQDDWIPLWPPELYAERAIDLRLGSPVASVDTVGRTVQLHDGANLPFGSLLLATGADPVRLSIPVTNDGQILYLRSFADSQRIVERVRDAKRVAVVGASFIGLEVAASLRTRGVSVDVVAPEQLPLERVMGAELGRFIKALHESHGVVFHLGQTVASVDGKKAVLSGGQSLDADVVVAGVGVRPVTALAEQMRLKLDRGIVVNEFLETSASGIFAAGDVARWPDPHTGEQIRVEHWVVAQRQGQVAARNMLGRREPFDAVPFFWSQHYDTTIRYVGHAERWDAVRVDGSLDARDAAVSFVRGGRPLAVATISRDRACLEAEIGLERTTG